MTPQENFRCLAFHAERLEIDAVWNLVRRLADKLACRGATATFFVNPLGAIRAGADLTDKLKRLNGQGHEIAQHSHYYSITEATTTTGPSKLPSLLTSRNIMACIERDYEYLARMGFKPSGFVSGGWAINEAIFESLDTLGFTYDSSFRTYKLGYQNQATEAGDNCPGPYWLEKLLEIPTTGGIRQMLKARLLGATGISVGNTAYHLYYLHDTDLLSTAKRSALGLIEASFPARGVRTCTVVQLFKRLRPKVPKG